MTNEDIAQHNQTCRDLTAADGIPRLSWEQHGEVFTGPVMEYAHGAQVAAWDSATPGTVGGFRDGRYDVKFTDVGITLRYSASQLRPWPDTVRLATPQA